MNILVTGDRGEAGSVITASLIENNHKCIPYSDNRASNSIDAIVHTAAKSPYDTVNDIFSSNIIYHKKIVDSCKNLNSRIFFLSSVSIYDDKNFGTTNEDSCISPVGFYGASKYFGENYIKSQSVSGYALWIWWL